MDKIYIGSNGKIAAINPSNGEIIWQTKLASTYGDVSLIEKEKMLIVGSYGKLYGINKQNGDILWTNELTGWGYSNVGIAIEGASVQHKRAMGQESAIS